MHFPNQKKNTNLQATSFVGTAAMPFGEKEDFVESNKIEEKFFSATAPYFLLSLGQHRNKLNSLNAMRTRTN
jgi:hypothetical protein